MSTPRQEDAAAQSHWTCTGPPEGAAETIAVHPHDPRVVYAGTRLGVYRSSDGSEPECPSPR